VVVFLPLRLKIARQRRGWSKTELAARAGVSVRSISDYENDVSAPEGSTLGALARALEFPAEFFAGAELEELPSGTASFRAMSRMTARQRDAALAAGALAIEFSRWIDRRFELPAPNLPDLSGYEPEAAAHLVRQSWGLGEKPVRNIVHLLEFRGVRIFSLVEEGREVDAFSLWRDDVPFVFLNTRKTAERSRFDAAHELGHLLLHRHAHGACDASTDDANEVVELREAGRGVENEANLFASALLMPRASIVASVPRAPRIEQLIEHKRTWRVSLLALVHRMRGLRVISDWQYRNLCIEVSRRHGTQEPEGIEERETSQVLAKVFSELRQRGMSRSDVARSLRLPMRELDGLIFGLTLAGIDGNAEGDQESPRRDHLRLVR
jgi:Zn-dependent peptidase ImmA (M78 family)/DNA-binding XRE family transcriptional regulator